MLGCSIFKDLAVGSVAVEAKAADNTIRGTKNNQRHLRGCIPKLYDMDLSLLMLLTPLFHILLLVLSEDTASYLAVYYSFLFKVRPFLFLFGLWIQNVNLRIRL